MLLKLLRRARSKDITPLLRSAIDAQRAGDHSRAETLLRNAIEVAPAAYSPHALLAQLLATDRRDGEARALYERAVALGAGEPEFLFAYAALLTRSGDFARAEDVYRDITEARPQWPVPYVAYGRLALDRADWSKAVGLFERAIQLSDDTVEAHLGLALALLRANEISRAIRQCRTILERAPENMTVLDLLIAAHRRLGDVDDLRAALRERLDRTRSDGTRIALALALPSIVHSREEIRSIRNKLADDVDHLLGAPLAVADPYEEVGATTFYLAYHGEDDRELQARVAALHLHACEKLAFVAPHCARSRSVERDRLRVGIVSSCLYEHSIARVMHGLIARLDRTRFSMHLFSCNDMYDARSRALQRDADEWVNVPRDLAAARARIAAGELDVILYPDIGMDAFTYFLAFARLAPVQCTTWGHPVTTGIPAVDYFLSTDYFEAEHGEEHYTEKLVTLQDVAFPGYYSRPDLPPPLSSSVGFDRARRVYFCPQRLFKLHPDFDALIGEILRRDRGGEVVLVYVPQEDEWRLAQLQARLRRTCADVYDRIVFLAATASHAEYIERLRQCAVVLDTIHYCGGNTSLEAIAAGTLVVTLPSDLNRGRHTYGFMRKMRFTDTIAKSADAYVELAVRIAKDRELRAHLKAKQEVARAALYDDQNAVRQIESFFERAHVNAR